MGGGIAANDLAAALDFARAVTAEDVDLDMRWLLATLRAMFPGAELGMLWDQVIFADEAQGTRPTVFTWPKLTVVPLEPELELAAARHDPIRAYREQTGSAKALRISDVVADPLKLFALPHERAMIEHEERHYGTALHYQLTTRLRAGGARPAALSLLGAHEFCDRDVQLLDLLQPFIANYLRLFAAHRGTRSADATAGLTGREREILDHVAGGMTNRQIAVDLKISPDTVRKHLEHIYGKLDVSSRTAALARTGRANIA